MINRKLLILLIGIFLISFTSALNWDECKAWYDLDSDTPIDSTGNYNGDKSGTIATGLNGKIGKAYNFSAGYVNTTMNTNITGNLTFSVSLWFKTNNTGEMMMVTPDESSGDYFRFKSGSGIIEYPITAEKLYAFPIFPFKPVAIVPLLSPL